MAKKKELETLLALAGNLMGCEAEDVKFMLRTAEDFYVKVADLDINGKYCDNVIFQIYLQAVKSAGIDKTSPKIEYNLDGCRSWLKLGGEYMYSLYDLRLKLKKGKDD